jgi:tRNA pseudouridine13 synthase
MYKLKQIEEDFIVKEKLDLKFNEKGEYSYYLLEKKNISTFDCIYDISFVLKISSKYINASGLKDKKAITYQYISIKNAPKQDYSLDKFKLKFLGRGNDRINIGSHEGNYFEIVVRNIEKKPIKKDYILNFFDDQRFGKFKDNHIIGRMLIKREFKKVVELLIERNEYKIKDYLKLKPNDYIGALRKIPKKELFFYISAYQSYLWNECVFKYSKFNPTIDESFPLIGFGIEVNDNIKKIIIDEILKKENIILRDFIIREFPEITTAGSSRNIFSKIYDFKMDELENDEFNIGKKKIKICFYLNKGDYATNVCKNLFLE